jgi:glycine/D-amino acid oxidase-like deaminating enzyme
VNVLRDTHSALVPDGLVLDFHPVTPPWPRVETDGRKLGRLQDASFCEDLRATEGGMDEVVRQGLYQRLAARTHEMREYYEDAEELLESWEEGEWLSPELERRLRAATGPVELVEKVVFRLYRRIG